MRVIRIVGYISVWLFGEVVVAVAELSPDAHRRLVLGGNQHIGLWQALLKQEDAGSESKSSDENGNQAFLPIPSDPTTRYEARCFNQPVSHFSSSPNETFCQRYWLDVSSYEPGGPVYLLDTGEMRGEIRALGVMERGLLQILSNATKGLSIVLEHRYYGDSVPVKSLSADDLRFLNNEEATADSVNFIKNFRMPSTVMRLDDPLALHPRKTPWIYDGGSYPGARAAHMRVEYPDLVWGAIASSAVTHAQVEAPEYWDAIQKYGPKKCISALQSAVELIDDLLDLPEPMPTTLKSFFGLEQLADHSDFAKVLWEPLGAWQWKHWDPALDTDVFDRFCEALTMEASGGAAHPTIIPAVVRNYGKSIKENVVSECPISGGDRAAEIEDCFGTQNDTKFQNADLDQTWRIWQFQVCTQWGFFCTAPLEGPRIVSKRLNLEYLSKICRQAYPPGEHFTVPLVPDIENVNRRGDFAISADRLAFIDGDRDPWRAMTPGSDRAPKRNSTLSRPVHVILDAVHQYDQNGLADRSREPKRVQEVHELELRFVKEWLLQWDKEKARKGIS